MPQALFGGAAALFAAGSYGLAAVAAIGYIATSVAISMALSALSNSLAGKSSKSAGVVRDGREVTVSGTTQPRQLIYGECVTGGYIAHFGLNNTTTTNNDFLWFAIVVATHQCEEIGDIILDDRTILASESTGGSVTNAAFLNEAGTAMCFIYKHLGTHNQTYDTTMGAWLSEWTSAHRGAGIAYFVIGMRKDDRAWPNGIPSNFRAKVKGKRLYDPRKDSTNGGSGAHRYTDATTWEWSRNSILCARDYLTGGSVYFSTATPLNLLGIREDNARINDIYIAANATICEEDVSIPDSTTEDRYTCDAQLSCDSTHAENMEILLSSCIGHVSYVNGKYRLHAGAYQTPGVTIDDDDILGALSIPTHPQGEDLYNSVTGTFYDEDRDWQQSNFPTRTQSTYQTDDGGEYTRSIELDATRGNYRAQRIADVHLEQSRNKITLSLEKLSPKAINIAEWDNFYLTCAKLGYVNQVFRCTKWQFKGGFIALEARIDSAASWADLDVGSYTDPNTNVAASSQVVPPSAPTGLVLTGFPTLIKVIVTLPAALQAGEIVEIWEHTSSSPFSSATKIAEGSQMVFNLAKRDTTTRYYWARVRLNGQTSASYPASTGTSAVADLTQSGDIALNAATEVLYPDFEDIVYVITTAKHTPDGFTWNTATGSQAYTAAVDCVVTVIVVVEITIEAASGTAGGFCYHSIQDAASFSYQDASFGNTALVPAYGTNVFSSTITKSFVMTAGQTKTFQHMATKLDGDDEMTVNIKGFRLEAIKR